MDRLIDTEGLSHTFFTLFSTLVCSMGFYVSLKKQSVDSVIRYIYQLTKLFIHYNRLLDYTYPFLQTVPLRGRVFGHNLSCHWQHHLSQEVIPSKHVRVPNTYPQCSTLNLIQRHVKLKSRFDACYKLLHSQIR